MSASRRVTATTEEQPQFVLPSLPRDVVLLGDCLDVMRTLPDASVDAVVTDPPYFRVKGEAWDRQWDSAASFLAWMAQLRDEWFRLLKPNGSLYVFASPEMATRVDVLLRERFHVLNLIRWEKRAHSAWKASRDQQRMYLAPWEAIIFAEHYGSDSMALGESGYAAQCERAHGLVFEPLRAYLDGERRRAGIDKADCNVACGFSRTPGGMASRHYFSRSQWQLPTAPHYTALQRLFNEQGRRPAPPFADFHPAGSPFARFHTRPQIAEYLRADYEDLRADYEDLRRPFHVTEQDAYTDVWTFPTVASYPGKHPCEKPLALLRHIVRTSTRPGALILDAFAGSGAIADAARHEGRHYLGIERDAFWVERAKARLAGRLGVATVAPSARPVVVAPKPKPHRLIPVPAVGAMTWNRPSLWEGVGA